MALYVAFKHTRRGGGGCGRFVKAQRGWCNLPNLISLPNESII